MSDVKVWSAVTITDKVMQDRPCPDYFVAEGDYDALREDVARLRAQAIDLQAELVLAQQQVGHLRQQPIALLRAAEEFVQYFDSNFVNPGLELCGLVNGQQIAPSGVQLNDLLACLRAALTQGKGGVNG